MSARTGAGQASVSTGGSAAVARSAEGRVSVSTVGGVITARSAEGQASVSTGGSAVGARSAEGRVSVSTDGSAITARSVKRENICQQHRSRCKECRGASTCQHGWRLPAVSSFAFGAAGVKRQQQR